jgi:putative membrane protein insertion efficiency factor
MPVPGRARTGFARPSVCDDPSKREPRSVRVKYLGIGLVYAWRYTFGLLTPAGTCKYHPSCSQYALDALHEHGLLRGSALAGWRLLRCNPWSRGGVDYVKPRAGRVRA